MPIQNAQAIKDKIISLIQTSGPSLPVHIARATGLNTIFAGAFLSELYGDKRIRISHMKVGGSPLYFAPGQEAMLENYSHFLGNKEKEAYSIIKEKRVVKDSELEPAIRVAMKFLKDFAFQFQNPKDQQVYWRYLTFPENEALILLEPPKPIIEPKPIKQEKQKIEKRIEPQIEIKEKEAEIKKERKPRVKREKPLEIEEDKDRKEKENEKPLLVISSPPKIKEKTLPEKSEFVLNTLSFLEKNGITLVEEKSYQKKDFIGIGKINSGIGEMEVLIIAKDKKRISESDLTSALQNLNVEKKTILFLSPGELDKKSKDFINSYKGLIRFLRI